MAGQEARLSLSTSMRSVLAARNFMRQTVTAWGLAHAADSAVRCSGELVTDAIHYGEGTRELVVSNDGGWLRVVLSVAAPAGSAAQVTSFELAL